MSNNKMLAKVYTTSLESADRGEIVRVLNDKLNATSPQNLVDYVGLSVENLEDRLERLKVAKSEIALIETATKAQIEYIKLEVAEFFSSNGISKIEGDRISSITTSNPKPVEELHYEDENVLIQMGYAKTSLDKTAVKNAIKNRELSDAYAYITHSLKPTTIKINKKRGA